MLFTMTAENSFIVTNENKIFHVLTMMKLVILEAPESWWITISNSHVIYGVIYKMFLKHGYFCEVDEKFKVFSFVTSVLEFETR